MTWKTPSSLKWLICKHARQQGELARLEKELAEKKEQLDQTYSGPINKVQEAIKSIEAVMRLHEMSVDPDIIAPVAPRLYEPLFKRGEITRSLYKAMSNGQWVRTDELIAAVSGLYQHDTQPKYFRYVRHQVRSRLFGLLRNGKVERKAGGSRIGRDQSETQSLWRLTPGKGI
jgi:hypothetical protein